MGSVCATCGAEATASAGTCPKCGGRLAASVSETLPFDEEDKRLLALAQTVAAEPLYPERPDTTLSDPALARAAAPDDLQKTLALPEDQVPVAPAATPAKATMVLSEHDALINQAINPAAAAGYPRAAGSLWSAGGEPAPYVPPRDPVPARQSKKGRGCTIAVVLAILLVAAAGGLALYLTQHTGLLSPSRSEPREAPGAQPDDGDKADDGEGSTSAAGPEDDEPGP